MLTAKKRQLLYTKKQYNFIHRQREYAIWFYNHHQYNQTLLQTQEYTLLQDIKTHSTTLIQLEKRINALQNELNKYIDLELKNLDDTYLTDSFFTELDRVIELSTQ